MFVVFLEFAKVCQKQKKTDLMHMFVCLYKNKNILYICIKIKVLLYYICYITFQAIPRL